jgi:hypothetical protein
MMHWLSGKADRKVRTVAVSDWKADEAVKSIIDVISDRLLSCPHCGKEVVVSLEAEVRVEKDATRKFGNKPAEAKESV